MRVLLLLLCGLSCTSWGCAPQPSRGGLGEPAGAQPPWACFVAEEARGRKQQVESGMLPRVVFAGEDSPATIESRRARHKVPALSVAAIHNGRLEWSAAWGALQAGGAPAACSSLFQAGSLAKPVTVLAALRMKEQGRIDFDQPIETYLTSYRLPPGQQTASHPVTFRNLFTHTAGITPGGYDGYAQGQPMPSDLQTVRGEAPSNARKVEVLEVPGTSLVYSGGGYTVAEIALQDRFQEPFERLLRQWLLAPVGMRQADFTQPLPAASRPLAAHGHQADGTAVPGGWHNHPEQAAAGLWATASDLAAFLVELAKGYRGESKVFSPALVRELVAEPIDQHAFGFRWIGEGEEVFLTHYGGTVGYRAGMTLNLSTGNGAVFLTNSDAGMDLGREFLQSMARAYGWPQFREIQVTRAVQTPDVLRSLTGRYVFAEQGWQVSVVYEGGAAALVFPNGDRYAMVPIEGGPREFIHPATGVRARFEGEGIESRIHLYGQEGRRQAGSE